MFRKGLKGEKSLSYGALKVIKFILPRHRNRQAGTGGYGSSYKYAAFIVSRFLAPPYLV